MKTTVLLGKGELAVRAADWFHRSPAHRLALVVPVIPEPSWTTSLATWCSRHCVPMVESGDYREVATRLDAPIDLAMSIFYDKIISAAFIDNCRTIVNLHNSPLPRYRGVSPINWALKNGETSHGVTIHGITPRVDDGPVYGQTSYSIYPESDEVADVLARSVEYGWTLFRSTLPLLDEITPVEQDDADATLYTRADDHRLGDRRSFTRAESVICDGVR